ncbi:MAG TPA: tetratricopeptide repeat protein [Pseudonocardiaceae bacterium]|nr:tetratricopeptide repeat protein [Pseudonocardiaceae bacterium]
MVFRRWIGVDVRVLGSLEIEAGGCLVQLGPQQRRVFLALLLQKGQVVSGTRLGELIWGEPVPDGGAATVRSHVMRLRRALRTALNGGSGEIELVTQGGGYALRVCPDRVDAVRFETLLAQGRDALAAGDPGTAGEVLRSGLGLWRGPVLAEVADRSFALAEVARLEGLRRVALLARIEADLAMGLHGELVGELEGHLAAAPHEETLRRHLALALYRCQRTEDAARVCQQGLKLLADRGVDSPRLQNLQEEILRGAPGLDWRPSAPAATPPEPTATGVALHTLPRDLSSFTGRQGELRQLMVAVTGRSAAGGVVGIHAIGGMAGIGKTAFAVHAAHRLAPHFPDGQIFLRLHAHTLGQRPVDPAEALATLLLIRGITPQQIPPDAQARELLWRDHLCGRKVLLVLDDAAGPEQVDPLLPGTAECLVLITSRRRLGALDDAVSISLDTLTPADAVTLFRRVATRPHLELTDTGVAEVTRLCGYLPLAIRLVAGQLHSPGWTLADAIAELTTARNRLAAMDAGQRSVAAAFDLSYQELSHDQQRLFRQLGLQPGTDIDAYATAALHDTTLASARRQLRDLYARYVLDEPVRGRYRLHDLLRDYAQLLAERDPPAERDAAIDRLLDYYLHTATLAASHLDARSPTVVSAAHPPRFTPEPVTHDTAIAWLNTEHTNLRAAADYAARRTRERHAIHLPDVMHEFLRMQGSWGQALGLHHTALNAAREASDRLGEAAALTNLGDLHCLMDDYPAAIGNLERALTIHRELGNQLGQAHALNLLGMAQRLTIAYPAATASLERALALYRDLGNQRGQARSLYNLGTVQRLMGDYPAATASLARALELYRDLGNRIGEANGHAALGMVQHLTGDYSVATASLERALELYRHLGDRIGEAEVLNTLGAVRRLTGDYRGATISLEQALVLYRDLGNRRGEGLALDNLATVQRLTGDYPSATASLERSLVLARDLGNRHAEGHVLNNSGTTQRLTGDYAAASASLEQALALYRDLGNRIGEAYALNNLGTTQRLAGDYVAASASLEQALALYRNLGNRIGEAETLNNLGHLLAASGAPANACAHHAQALSIAQTLGTPLEEARALEGIGRCHRAQGRASEGVAYLREALTLYQRLGSPDANHLEETLREAEGGLVV